MTPELQDLLQEIDRLLSEARASGDRAAEAATRERAAATLIELGELEHARPHLDAALARHLADGRTRDAANVRYVRALAESRLGEGPGAAAALLREALSGFQAAGEAGMSGRCRFHLAGIALNDARIEDADALLAAAAQDFAAAGDTTRRREAISGRLMTLQLLSRPDEALRLSQELIVLSEGDLAASLKARLDRLPLLRQLPGGPDLPRDNLDAILAEAERAGQVSLSGQARLARASERAGAGDLPGALADAEAARRAALTLPDPVLYLLAGLSIAEIEEARGDRVRAVTALFTCQASLADLLGEEARRPVLLVIHSTRKRWGEAAWQQVMAAYRAQF